ncbi:MAG: response regulator transcription factor [Sphaerochaetaceae bacterium]
MRILLVDDDELIVQSMAIILGAEGDLDIVGQVNSGSAAIRFVREHEVDLVLMDVRMPGMDGITATQIIREEQPRIKIIMLTTFHDYRYIHRSLQAGASGYILKSDESDTQVMTIRAVYAGLPVISEHALQGFGIVEGDLGLSQRENEIFFHVANGLSNKEISERLCISEGTVRNTISVILEKLQLRDRTQLAIRYWQHKGF